MKPDSCSRRAVLSGAVVALAGCAALDRDASIPRFQPDELDRLLERPAPDLVRPAPIQPSESVVESGMARAEDLLDSVPDPIPPEDVPNESTRERIDRFRQRAVDRRERVLDAPDRFHTLESLRGYRRHSRRAAAALEAFETNTGPAIHDERNEIRAAVLTRLATARYVGDDASRTLLLAARFEDALESARRVLRWRTDDDPRPIVLGSLAGRAEFGHATLALVDHLAERHAERLQRAVDFESGFDLALERSLDLRRIDDSRLVFGSPEDLFGAAIDREAVRFLIDVSMGGAQNRLERIDAHATAGRIAAGLDETLHWERDVRALERIVDHVETDGFDHPETVDPVSDAREAAIDAAEAMPVDTSRPTLAGDVAARTVDWIRTIDVGIEARIERDRESEVTFEYARYLLARARIESLPDAVEAFRARLDAAAADV